MESQIQTPEQPSQDSGLQDRIAAKFGGSDPEPAEPTETASEPAEIETEAAPVDETFELDYEGAKYTLPKKLEKGFMQERDYTHKSQSLADQRRVVELAQRNAHLADLAQQFQTETAQEHQQLQALEWALAQPVDWASMSTEDALRRKLQMDGWATEKGRLEKVIDGKRKEWDGKQQTEFTKLVNESLEVIKKRIPGWGPDVAKAITEHALREGFTETELRKANTDPRLAVALWKAQQYDAIKAKAVPAAAPARAIKTTPTTPMPTDVKEKLAYRKNLQKAPPGSPERKRLISDRAARIFSR